MVQELPIKPKARFWHAADDFWREHGVGEADHVFGVHMRGTDKKCHAQPGVYAKYVRAYACQTPNLVVFVATDDRDIMETVRSTWNTSQFWSMKGTTCAMPPRVLWRDSLRGFGRFNAGVLADNRRINLTSSSNAARLGTDVMMDTLLLARSNYLLGSNSAVANFAVYFNPQLQNNSHLIDVRDHPSPSWFGSLSPA